MTLADILPVFQLRLATPSLELHLPGGEDLASLGELAARGVHHPARQPFGAEWTDQPVEAIPAAVVQYNWAIQSRIRPGTWELGFVVRHAGQIIGTQSIGAKDFAIRREVHTGSWLGQAYQGRGFGTEMRAAVLELAFAGLAATLATTSAYTDNEPSNAVSRKLGYQPNGTQRDVIRGRVQVLQHLVLTPERWAEQRAVPVTIDGLDACREWLIGPTDGTAPAGA
jgi:RimJ/RimL family protein N-acetyltransferase